MTDTDISEAILANDRIRPFGGGTKPRLSESSGSTFRLDLRDLQGITEYQSSEYTITARAGTTIRELKETLAREGQYLPFDPLWADAGATLGGTVAANAAGPGRFRFGGVRDFILGVTLIDGRGKRVVGGGKVVKNAAGFDLPKFMVGSMGRWGVMTDITCKVFPRPPASMSRQWHLPSHQSAGDKITELSRSRFEADALEYLPNEKRLVARFAGPEQGLHEMAAAIGGEAGPSEFWWSELNEFAWAEPGSFLVRVALTPRTMVAVLPEIDQGKLHVSAGGNCLWIAGEDLPGLSDLLVRHQLAGLVYRGPSPDLWMGQIPNRKIDAALQAVFDPDHRFANPL